MKSLLENYIKVLKENNQLIIIDEEIDPDLEMASTHLHHFKHGNKAVFFKNVKRTRYSALSVRPKPRSEEYSLHPTGQ